MGLIKALFKFVGYVVAVLVIAVGIMMVVAQFSDGPLEIVAGGPFKSGEQATEEPDWSFLGDVNTVEFQLLDPDDSRTTWIAEVDGRVFIPCGYMTTWWGKIWKQWPSEAVRDGRVILRANGKLYDRRLVRIESGPEIEPILAELGRKYGGGAPFPVEAVTSGYLWIFELTPRN